MVETKRNSAEPTSSSAPLDLPAPPVVREAAEGIAGALTEVLERRLLQEVVKLGSDDFDVREAADHSLRSMAFISAGYLARIEKTALVQSDPEVRRRVEGILADLGSPVVVPWSGLQRDMLNQIIGSAEAVGMRQALKDFLTTRTVEEQKAMTRLREERAQLFSLRTDIRTRLNELTLLAERLVGDDQTAIQRECRQLSDTVLQIDRRNLDICEASRSMTATILERAGYRVQRDGGRSSVAAAKGKSGVPLFVSISPEELSFRVARSRNKNPIEDFPDAVEIFPAASVSAAARNLWGLERPMVLPDGTTGGDLEKRRFFVRPVLRYSDGAEHAEFRSTTLMSIDQNAGQQAIESFDGPGLVDWRWFESYHLNHPGSGRVAAGVTPDAELPTEITDRINISVGGKGRR